MPRRRRIDVFSLSFLDAMTCGFGAVVLFFMVIQSSVEEKVQEETLDRSAEVDRLEEEVLEGHEQLVRLRNSLRQAQQEQARAQGLSTRLIETLVQLRVELATFEAETLAQKEHMNRLVADLKSLEEDTKRLAASIPDEEVPGDARRVFIGDGNRQYLTGLKVGGDRILVLVDRSASMLADTVVNAVVRRNLPDEEKRRSAKWRRAVATVDWLATQVPEDAHFQVYSFADEAAPVVDGTRGKWLDAADRRQLDGAVSALRRQVPAGGTNLEGAFQAIRGLKPEPDNIILLVDGLPTRGNREPRGSTVTANERLRHFDRATDSLPKGTPLNIILFPMEGDPMAASAYWRLAIATYGSFLAPPEDWP